MSTIVRLAGNRAVATRYGLYNTICGAGIAAGNLATGVPWLSLARDRSALDIRHLTLAQYR